MNHLKIVKNKIYFCNLLAVLFVTIFRMIFDTIHIFITFFTARNRTRKRFLIRRIVTQRSGMPVNLDPDENIPAKQKCVQTCFRIA